METVAARRATHCAIAVLLAFAATAHAEIKTYHIARTNAPPRIDGALDDACWKGALAIGDFGLLGRGKASADAPVPPTTAMLAYDADALYVAYRCTEPLIDKLVTRATRHDGKTWADDCVEIFFDPTATRQRYVQLAINTAGVVMDAAFGAPGKGMDLGYESGATAKAKIGAKAWTLEVRVPFAGLPIANPSGAWTFHLARTRSAAGQHLTMLRTPTGGFHEIANFDRLEGIALPERPVSVTVSTLGSLCRGRNLARATLRNWGRRTQWIDVSAGLADAPNRTKQMVTIHAGKTATVELPWELGPDAVGKQASLTAYLGGLLLRRRTTAIGPLPDIFGRLRPNAYFIRSDAAVVLRVPIRIAEGSRRNVRLRWEARRVTDLRTGDGPRVGGGITVVHGPEAVVRLYWTRWRSGRYTLRFELLQANQPLATADHTVLLVESPTGDH